MKMLSIVMGYYDLTFLFLITIIAVLSVVIRKKLIAHQVEKKDVIVGDKHLATWRKVNIGFCAVVLLLIVLKMVTFTAAVYNEANAPVVAPVVKPAPIVKVEAKVAPKLNKTIFYGCLDKVKGKEGVPVDVIKACTEAAQIEVATDIVK